MRRHDPDRPLRLLYLTPDLPDGPASSGIGTYTSLIAHGMAERGHAVTVLTRSVDGRDRSDHADSVTIRHLAPARPALPEDLSPLELARLVAKGALGEPSYRRVVAQELARRADAGSVDLIESADVMAEGWLYRGRRRPQLPFVIRLHGPVSVGERFDRYVPEAVRRIVARMERSYLLGSSHLSVPSARAGRLIRAWLRLGNRPIRAIPNPPPTAVAAPGHPQKRAKDVLFVGRLSPMKGPDVLIAAAETVVAAHPDVTFTFVGADQTGDPSAADAARRLLEPASEAVRTRVRFVGKLPLAEAQRRMHGSAVVALPSRWEPFGYTCLEAMASGATVVGTTSGGMEELLDHGGAGMLVPPGDAAALASALLEALSDAELRARLGRAARRRFETRFARATVLDETEAFYREAIADCG